MIRSFDVPQKEVGTWVGLVSAIFSFCQCLTAVPWGNLSDRVGRKPVILAGTFMTMFFSTLFGLSKSLKMAIITRAFLGLGNGNIGIIRTVVAELVPERELQPRAFSIMPLMWTIGSIFGPAFGGALANPAERHPKLFGNIQFFKNYPFALPNLVSAVIFVVGITTAFLFLRVSHQFAAYPFSTICIVKRTISNTKQETLESKKDKRDYGLVLGDMITNSCSGKRHKSSKQSQKIDCETTPLLSNKPDSPESDDVKATKKTKESKPSWSQVFTSQSILILISYGFLSLHNLAFDAVVPVFLNHPVTDIRSNPDVNLPVKFTGGFGMGKLSHIIPPRTHPYREIYVMLTILPLLIDPQAIGFLFMVNSLVGMVVQFTVFPPVAKRFGVLTCYRVAAYIPPIVYLLTPFAVLLPTEMSRQIALITLVGAKLAAIIFAFPCSTILLTNAAPTLKVLGTLNGVATCVSAIGRGLGPACLGSLYSAGVKWGYVILPWWILAFVTILGAIPIFWIVETDGFAGHDQQEQIDEEEEGQEQRP